MISPVSCFHLLLLFFFKIPDLLLATEWTRNKPPVSVPAISGSRDKTSHTPESRTYFDSEFMDFRPMHPNLSVVLNLNRSYGKEDILSAADTQTRPWKQSVKQCKRNGERISQ